MVDLVVNPGSVPKAGCFLTHVRDMNPQIWIPHSWGGLGDILRRCGAFLGVLKTQSGTPDRSQR